MSEQKEIPQFSRQETVGKIETTSGDVYEKFTLPDEDKPRYRKNGKFTSSSSWSGAHNSISKIRIKDGKRVSIDEEIQIATPDGFKSVSDTNASDIGTKVSEFYHDGIGGDDVITIDGRDYTVAEMSEAFDFALEQGVEVVRQSG